MLTDLAPEHGQAAGQGIRPKRRRFGIEAGAAGDDRGELPETSEEKLQELPDVRRLVAVQWSAAEARSLPAGRELRVVQIMFRDIVELQRYAAGEVVLGEA